MRADQLGKSFEKSWESTIRELFPGASWRAQGMAMITCLMRSPRINRERNAWRKIDPMRATMIEITGHHVAWQLGTINESGRELVTSIAYPFFFGYLRGFVWSLVVEAFKHYGETYKLKPEVKDKLKSELAYEIYERASEGVVPACLRIFGATLPDDYSYEKIHGNAVGKRLLNLGVERGLEDGEIESPRIWGDKPPPRADGEYWKPFQLAAFFRQIEAAANRGEYATPDLKAYPRPFLSA